MTHTTCFFTCSPSRTATRDSDLSTTISSHYFTHCEALPPQLWDDLAAASPFLQADWQAALAQATPAGVSLRYIAFRRMGTWVGIMPLQLIDFDALRSIRSLNTPPHTFSQRLKRWVASPLRFKVLLVGNLLATGEHAFAFAPSVKSQAIPTLVHQALQSHAAQWRQERIAVTIIKEFFARPDQQAAFEALGYLPMTAQPNMILTRRSHWKTWDDYLADMTSKYRVRTKRAFKKGQAIHHQPLSLVDLQTHQSRLFELYQATMSQADFNTLYLRPEYLATVKAALSERFQVTGYWIDDKLVGFSSYIIGEHTLEAHFLGLDGTYNRTHQLYLNILYGHVQALLAHQKDQLVLARTALEIKSSIGADPHDMYAYVSFRSPFLQRIARRAAQWLVQPTDWTPRNPFPSQS